MSTLLGYPQEDVMYAGLYKNILDAEQPLKKVLHQV